jgi:type I restriction enzyme S subunit
LNSEIVFSQVLNEMSGSTFKRINLGSIKKFTIVVPEHEELEKIASILTSVDEVIENTKKQIDKLQDLKKATMNELLTKGIGHTEVKDSELGRILLERRPRCPRDILLTSSLFSAMS